MSRSRRAARLASGGMSTKWKDAARERERMKGGGELRRGHLGWHALAFVLRTWISTPAISSLNLLNMKQYTF